MFRRVLFTALTVASIFGITVSFSHAQVSNVPRLTNITLVEEGETYPAVASRDGAVQIKPGKLLKERNMQSLARLLGNYIGWPADGSTVEAIGRTLASWGKGNSLYFNLLAPISIPPNLTLTLYPKGSGPSFLTYTQPKLSDMDIWSNSATAKAPSYWVDMEEPVMQQQQQRMTAPQMMSPQATSPQVMTPSQVPQSSVNPYGDYYNYSGGSTYNNNGATQRKDVLIRNINQQLQDAREDRREMEERMRSMESELSQFKEKSQQTTSQVRESQIAEQNLAMKLQALQKEREELMQESSYLSRQLQGARTAQQEADQRIRSMETQRSQGGYFPQNSDSWYQSNVGDGQHWTSSLRNETSPLSSYSSSTSRMSEEWESINLPQSSSLSNRVRDYNQDAEMRLRQLKEEQNQLRGSSQLLDQQLQQSRSNQQAVEQRIQALQSSAPSVNRTIRLDDESPLTVNVTPDTDINSAISAARSTQSSSQQQSGAVEREVQQRLNVMVEEELQKEKSSSSSSKSNASDETIPMIDEEPPDSLQMKVDQPSEDSVATHLPTWRFQHLLVGAGIRPGGVQLVSLKVPGNPDSTADTSPIIIQRVIVSEKGNPLSISIPKGVIVSMPLLTSQAVEKIKSAAQVLIDQPYSMVKMRLVGVQIGMILKENGERGYDVVLLKQEMANGTLHFEIRKNSAA